MATNHQNIKVTKIKMHNDFRVITLFRKKARHLFCVALFDHKCGTMDIKSLNSAECNLKNFLKH